MAKISGACLCGAIRRETDAEPVFSAKCYCTDCRKTSGAGHSAHSGFTPAERRIGIRQRRAAGIRHRAAAGWVSHG